MRITKIIIFSFVVLFFHSLVNDNALSQVSEQNQLEINLSYMVPNSEIVFKRSYGGIIGLNLKYLRRVTHTLLLGGLFEHSRFEIDDPDLIDSAPITRHTKMKIYSGGIIGGVEYPMNKTINSIFQIGFGYSWVSLKNKPNNFSFTESGPLLRPLFTIQFLFSKMGLSLSVAYPIIFEHFADNTSRDDSTIRWWDFSGGIVYSF
ncbi:MAG TPA: hypothetical protein VGD14_08560 [bacterium]